MSIYEQNQKLRIEWLENNKNFKIEVYDPVRNGWNFISEPDWESPKEFRKNPFEDYKPLTKENGEWLIGKAIICNASGDLFLIANVARDRIRHLSGHVKFEDLLRYYHFCDGRPCGIYLK